MVVSKGVEQLQKRLRVREHKTLAQIAGELGTNRQSLAAAAAEAVDQGLAVKHENKRDPATYTKPKA